MKKIKISKDKYTLVDDSDYEWLNTFNWFANKVRRSENKYRVMRNKSDDNPFVYMHRMILNISDPTVKIDHIDRDPLNNQRNNLRVCDDAQNACNVSSAKNSTSKYLGVSFHKGETKYMTKNGIKICRSPAWRATIFVNYKQIELGRFKKEIDAAKAYNEAAAKLHGQFANLNIIE